MCKCGRWDEPDARLHVEDCPITRDYRALVDFVDTQDYLG